jgi:hypothetical protein
MKRIAFLPTIGGAPILSGPLPSFLSYTSKLGVARPVTPTISRLSNGLCISTASADDVREGVAYLIENPTGSSPRYIAGSVHTDAKPFGLIFLTDGSETLWAGSAPSVSLFDFNGTSRTPTLQALFGSCLYALIINDADLATGVGCLVTSPSGAFPSYYSGAFGLAVAGPGTSLAEDLVAALEADATVISQVSTRIYPNLRPPAPFVLPFVVYSVISQTVENALAESAQTRLKHTRVQFDVYGSSYISARAAATAVENVLANLPGPDLVGYKDSERDLYDNETGLHRVSTDYILSRG